MPRLSKFSFVYGCLIFLCYSLIAISCSGHQRKYIIPQNKFVDVLVDIHLADAIALEYRPEYSGFVLDSAELYGSVFRKHDITKEQFDSTMSYYSSHPSDFQKVYNKVIGKINLLRNELLEPDTVSAEPEEVVWFDDRTYAFPEISPSGNIDISVPLPASGSYTLSATIKLYADDESLDPRIGIYYWYDNNSTLGYRDSFPEVLLEKDGQQHTYTLKRSILDSRVTHLKGSILKHSGADDLSGRHALVSEIKVSRSP